MQGPLSSDSALAVFPGQGTLGQGRGHSGGGEKQRDLGEGCTRGRTCTLVHVSPAGPAGRQAGDGVPATSRLWAWAAVS